MAECIVNDGSGGRAGEWRPGVYSVVALYGCLAVLLISASIGTNVYGLYYGSVRLGFVFVLAWIFLIPLVQYLLLRRPAARPRLGFAWSVYPRPFSVLKDEEHWICRRQFALVCAVPAILVLGGFPLVAVLSPADSGAGVGSLILLAATFAVYWLHYSPLALRQPPGTLVQETERDRGGAAIPAGHYNGEELAADREHDLGEERSWWRLPGWLQRELDREPQGGWTFWVFGAVGILQISYGLYSCFLSGYESEAAWPPKLLQLPAGVILLYIAGVELQPRGRPRRVWWLWLAGFPLLVLVLAWILYGMLVL